MSLRNWWRRPSFSGLLPRAARAAFPAALGAALLGCAPTGTEHNADGSRMTRDEMLVRGDDLKIEGLRLKTDGTNTGNDAMARRGDALLAQGQKLIDKANAMPKDEGK